MKGKVVLFLNYFQCPPIKSFVAYPKVTISKVLLIIINNGLTYQVETLLIMNFDGMAY